MTKELQKRWGPLKPRESVKGATQKCPAKARARIGAAPSDSTWAGPAGGRIRCKAERQGVAGERRLQGEGTAAQARGGRTTELMEPAAAKPKG